MDKLKANEKYILSAEEAAEYFHIGINKLRRLINNADCADWILYNGSHAYIKRVKFEQYIDKISSL